MPTGRRPTLRYDRAALDRVRELMLQAGRAADDGDYRQAAEALATAGGELDRGWWLLVRRMRADGLSWPAIGRVLSSEDQPLSWQGVYGKFRRFDKRFRQATSPPARTAPSG